MLKGFFDRLRGSKAVELPGYTPLGVIREGSMSVIFRAKERQTGRTVAVKVYKPGARKAIEKIETLYRDLTEGQVTAAFDHPNIVTCLAHGDLAGAPYVVLEYLEGMTLSSLMVADSRRLEGRRLSFVRDGAAALAHVHMRRFIHHDFCPKNVFITNDNRVKLIDFGLATPVLDRPGVGARMGTAEVLAPEVLRREPSDHRIDIFAWGVVAYEVVSGHWPFESIEQHQTLTKILNVHPIPLERRVPDLPEEVCALIMRCLEKDPEKRPNSMTAAVAVLERHRRVKI
jgi:serine/threonine protein kinase